VDVSKLDEDKTKRFYALASTLPSPCGKAHSLRTSITEDTSCKRASFAARYVIEMLSDEASDSDAKQFYELHYNAKGDAARKSFKLDATAPHSGPSDAPVKVVEFYDYGCPTCAQYVPLLKEALTPFPDQAVLYYKQFPLSSHVHSKGAAQAALAAHEQGKFQEMHTLLFARAPNHTKPELTSYAKSLGLDMARFEASVASVRSRVEADMAEGNAAGLTGTPTVYINGVPYEGPHHPKYMSLWIEEELAVNR
jgi:protein-disulfide isomerase